MKMKTRALLGVATAVLAALAGTSAYADEAAAQTITVTAGRLEGARAQVDKTPGGADVVTAADYANPLAVSLRDALAFSPGIYLQPRYGQEVRISVRGSGLSRGYHMRGLTLLQDGMPINLADDNGDFQELDPLVFERIEVYRGSNALRLGGSALGGAINAVTPTGRTAPRFEARLDGGSFSTLRGKIAGALATDRGDAYVALTSETSDGDRQHAERSGLRFNGNAGLRLSDRVETRFYASLNRIRQDSPSLLTREQAIKTPWLALPSTLQNDVARDLDAMRVQNRTTVAFGNGQLMAGGYFAVRSLYHPVHQVIDQEALDRGLFAQLDVQGEVSGLPVELTLGTTARFGDVNNKNYINIGGQRGALVANVDWTARTINTYGEVRLRPVEPLTLIAGGIFTNAMRRTENHTSPARSGDAAFNAFSPKFGVIYAVRNDVQVFANVSRMVEMPGFTELNQIPYSAGGVLPPGFVDLDSPKAWTVEAGARGQVGIARFDIAVFRTTLRGELLHFDQAPNVPAAVFNAERTLHQGIEAGLSLAIASWAQVRQVYTYSDFRFRGDAQYGDNRLPVVPKHNYRAALRLGSKRFHITPAVEWVPQGAWADYRNTTRVPGYALLSATAEADLGNGVVLFLDGRNLTGKNAIGDISAAVQATPASAIYSPVERRAVYGGVRARF